jgi:EAL domain-containing protein (putative c-di-GMP-specific phosphodiesterase class I)
MGLQVTAEGVETRQHQEFLSHAGVDEMQGFLFSEACRESELNRFFDKANSIRRRAA